MKLEIKEAVREDELNQVRQLFREYQRSVGTDLCFQSFEQELQSLPGAYSPPKGMLYALYAEDELAGCIALKPLDELRCEMKRLYIRSQFRGNGFGRVLVERVIAEARKCGYHKMLLDTLTGLEAAIGLYKSLGFYETDAYNDNPVEQVLFFCLDL